MYGLVSFRITTEHDGGSNCIFIYIYLYKKYSKNVKVWLCGFSTNYWEENLFFNSKYYLLVLQTMILSLMLLSYISWPIMIDRQLIFKNGQGTLNRTFIPEEEYVLYLWRRRHRRYNTLLSWKQRRRRSFSRDIVILNFWRYKNVWRWCRRSSRGYYYRRI